MKKLIITIIIALGFGMSLNAQKDSFFTYNNINQRNDATWVDSNDVPIVPLSHGDSTDQSSVSVGNALLLLTGFALTYCVKKRE